MPQRTRTVEVRLKPKPGVTLHEENGEIVAVVDTDHDFTYLAEVRIRGMGVHKTDAGTLGFGPRGGFFLI